MSDSAVSSRRWHPASPDLAGFEATCSDSSPRQLPHDVSDLRHDQLRHRQADRVLRPRQREDRACGRSCRRRRGSASRPAPICCVAEHAEQLAEPVEPLLEQRGDGLEGAVAGGDAGAARGDDDLGGERPWRRRTARDRSGSSRTMSRPVTSCPAAVSVSTIASPLVSVPGVRVSLIVRTKHRTHDRRVLAVERDGHARIISAVVRAAQGGRAYDGIIRVSLARVSGHRPVTARP